MSFIVKSGNAATLEDMVKLDNVKTFGMVDAAVDRMVDVDLDKSTAKRRQRTESYHIQFYMEDGSVVKWEWSHSFLFPHVDSTIEALEEALSLAEKTKRDTSFANVIAEYTISEIAEV